MDYRSLAGDKQIFIPSAELLGVCFKIPNSIAQHYTPQIKTSALTDKS